MHILFDSIFNICFFLMIFFSSSIFGILHRRYISFFSFCLSLYFSYFDFLNLCITFAFLLAVYASFKSENAVASSRTSVKSQYARSISFPVENLEAGTAILDTGTRGKRLQCYVYAQCGCTSILSVTSTGGDELKSSCQSLNRLRAS